MYPLLVGGCCLVAALTLLLAGCDRSQPGSSSGQVVLYTSIDQPAFAPIIAEFEAKTGIDVLVQTDTEATKSAGLAARLEAERDRPRADVWWGNEVFHTIRLAEAGVLAAFEPAAAADVPGKFKDAGQRWTGAGLRVRVVATNGTAQGDAFAAGMSIHDLLRPEHRGKAGIARPTAGTTGGHMAALYVLWGPEQYTQFLTRLKANDVKLLGGNGPVAEAVGRGELTIGLTDNDDVAAVRRNGGSIVAGLPDQDGAGVGTLAIPTTVALVAGAPNPDPGRLLVNYLASAEVERKLIEAKFAGWSVRGGTSEDAIRTMDVDYRDVARAMPEAVRVAMTILEGRE